MTEDAQLLSLSRETTIRRNAEGQWFHDGEPVENERLARAFDRWVERADDGRYCLRNSINWAYITLEGPPYFVRKVRVEGDRARITLSNDQEQPLDVRSLREGPDHALYCTVQNGLCARFDKHAAVQLGELLEEDEAGPYLLADGDKIRPHRVENPLTWEPTALPERMITS